MTFVWKRNPGKTGIIVRFVVTERRVVRTIKLARV